ncbi:MAG TPA: response regulator transcription factor [Acidimicrobiales bacterium]|jgi:DNA-binding NarL/FixJ family response regulator|nr:response regulator transcription factor [Acidimicrobiales bacterium]
MIRIAIIDDHEMVREGLRAILDTEPDFDVVAESGTADDVVQLVGAANPEVILLDARLPGLSGPAACRLLAASHPEVAVLIISTYSDDELVDECIRAGARGYLIKDIERFSLKESIRAVHRGEGAVSPAVAGKVLDRLRSAENAETPTEPKLSESQREILRLIAEGYSNREIASRVYLSENTVKSHVQEIFRKLDVRNRVEAAILATKEGWL